MIHVELQVKPTSLSLFFPLFEKGVGLSAEIGCTLREFLCDQIGISNEYLDQRIQTLFLDARPVDDVDTAVIRDGATVALSAAMPGLVGATMRKGGRYAAFRQDISQCSEENGADCTTTGRVILKMFNMVASELGSRLLEAGVEIDGDDLRWVMGRSPTTAAGAIVCARRDGQEVEPDEDFFATLTAPRLWLTVHAAA